ncbi:MAG: TlpA family protein disulfide reductase [Terriglobales bacterium]
MIRRLRVPAARFRPQLIPLLFFFVVAGSAFAQSSGESKEKEPAPRFNATTTTGEKFNNASLKGKVVLLEFWTTWCTYCEYERPFVERLNEDFGNKGLVILAVNVGEGKKTVKKYMEEHPRKTRIVLTENTNLAAMYAAKSYPIYVVLDREGNVAGKQDGAAGESALRNLVATAGLEGVNEDADNSK